MKVFKKLHNIHPKVHPIKKLKAKRQNRKQSKKQKKNAQSLNSPEGKQLVLKKEHKKQQMIYSTKQHARGIKGAFINLGHKIGNSVYSHCYNMAYRHFFPKVTDDEYASPRKALYPDDSPKGDYDTGYNDTNMLKTSWIDEFLRGALSTIKPDEYDDKDFKLTYQAADDELNFQTNLIKRIAKKHMITYRDLMPLFAADKKHRAKKHFNSRRLRDDGYPTDGTYENKVENLLRNNILSSSKFLGFRKVNHDSIAEMLWKGISQDRTNIQTVMKRRLANENKTPYQISQILVQKTKDPTVPLSPWGSDPANNPYNQPQNN